MIQASLCCPDVLDLVGEGVEVAPERVLGDDNRSAAVVGMEAQRRSVPEAAVEEEDDMRIRIVDQPEGADAAGFESEITHHPFG